MTLLIFIRSGFYTKVLLSLLGMSSLTKKTFFNSKQTDITKDLYTKLDTLIKKIQLPNTQTKNKVFLEDNKEIFKPSIQEEDNNINNKPVQTFNKLIDF